MRAATILLPMALVLNVAAFILPFVTVTIGLSTEDYSLLHSVSLLWKNGFPGLCILAGAFSVVFPFAKLVVLAGVCWCGWSRRWADTIGSFGKWSMLDLFLVILLLAVSYDRLLVAAAPKWGFACFGLAIVCSMVAGEYLHSPVKREPRVKRSSRWVTLILAAIGTAFAMVLPLFATDAWFMSNVHYSLIGVGNTLLNAGAWVPAIAVWLFLVLMPIVRLGCLVMDVMYDGSWSARARMSGRWSMLEPFALALGIFIFEGRDTVPTALGHGGMALIAAIVVSAICNTALARR